MRLKYFWISFVTHPFPIKIYCVDNELASKGLIISTSEVLFYVLGTVSWIKYMTVLHKLQQIDSDRDSEA